MIAIYVTIGRDIKGTYGPEPMDIGSWRTFVEATRSAMVGAFGGRPEVHTGTGSWDGHAEESAVLSSIIETVAPITLEVLRGRLARLARAYGQECIALVVAPSELIPATAPMFEVIAEGTVRV